MKKSKEELENEKKELYSQISKIDDVLCKLNEESWEKVKEIREREQKDRIDKLRNNKKLQKVLKDIAELPLTDSRTIKLEVKFDKNYKNYYDVLNMSDYFDVKVMNIEGLTKAEVKLVEEFLRENVNCFCILDKLGESLIGKAIVLQQKLEDLSGYADLEKLKELLQ